MIGRIGFEGLEVCCIIGVEEAERTRPQKLRVDFWLEYPIDKAAATDDLSHAIDYTRLVKEISHHLVRGEYQLMERAASTLLQTLGQHYSEAVHMWVRLTKSLDVRYFVALHWERA